jgi:hypothetical protein
MNLGVAASRQSAANIWAGSLSETQQMGRGSVCTKRIGVDPIIENMGLFGGDNLENSRNPSPVAKVRLKEMVLKPTKLHQLPCAMARVMHGRALGTLMALKGKLGSQ